jgi:methanogenic corrinoid protein MtbC1
LPLELVNEIISTKSAKNHAISSFKMAMMNFDQTLFFNTYNKLLSEKSFREVFYEVFIPLMSELGLLWQTDTITPAHEHFISYLIKQKLLINTEKVQVVQPTRTDKVFVLYLPMNEVHELGVMYLNYEILAAGYKTIYLGESVPTSSLKDVKKYFDNIVFVSYMTVQPDKEKINEYIEDIKNELLDDTTELWCMGRMTEHIDPSLYSNSIKKFESIFDMVNEL